MNRPESSPESTNQNTKSVRSETIWRNFISPAGYILAVSYPVLALSTGARALYQLFVRDDIVYYVPVVLSGVASICYLLAAVGFAYRRRWTWWLSVGVLAFETVMTLFVGTLSVVVPAMVGSTVWRHYGEDYGYFPLVQPLIGLVWLLWPITMQSYGVRPPSQSRPPLSAGTESGTL